MDVKESPIEGQPEKTADQSVADQAEDDKSSMTTSQTKQLSKRAQRRLRRKLERKGEIQPKPQQQPKPKNSNKSPNFEEAVLQETSCYFENGLRKVYPYHFTFTTYAKGRWYGRTVLDVFTTEFRNDTPENYAQAIESGALTVNGNAVSVDYKFKDNDFVSNTLHRHEVPVTAETISILADTPDLLVVDKPSSIPVHPCGRYRHNSLIYILAKEHGYRGLRTIYRLDRLTSGVFIFCKTEEKTRQLMQQVRSRTLSKTYLCRVEGEFPSEPVECEEPLGVLSHKVGLFKVSRTNGKEARTSFCHLSYNGSSSVVKCQPHTGRTHQIRVHLQYLGHPILNDPMYNNSVWGPMKGKGGEFGKPEEQLIEELIELHNLENYAEEVTSNKEESSLRSHDTETSESTDTVVVDDKNKCRIQHTQTDDKEDINRTSSTETDDIEHKDDTSNLHSTESKAHTVNQCIKEKITDAENNSVIEDKLLNSAAEKHQETMDSKCDIKSALGGESATSGQKTESEDNANSNNDVDQEGLPPKSKKFKPDPLQSDRPTFDPSKMTSDPACRECKLKFKDPRPDELVMYLHALSYKGTDWEFSTPFPEWAKPDWNESSGS